MRQTGSPYVPCCAVPRRLARTQGGSLSGSLRAGAVAASMMGGEMLQRPTTPASFGASLRGSGGLHAVAEAVEEPSPRRASRVPSSHGGAKAPLPSR